MKGMSLIRFREENVGKRDRKISDLVVAAQASTGSAGLEREKTGEGDASAPMPERRSFEFFVGCSHW